MLSIAKYDRFEEVFTGPSAGNPFMEVTFQACFSCGNRTVYAEGFYDGDDRYILRMMPDQEGLWYYETTSNVPELSGKKGTFICTPAREGVHGPVCVGSTLYSPFSEEHKARTNTRFTYVDGTDYQPVGTTCYAWASQTLELEEQTLETLRNAPFNKLRMCVFPKHYAFNDNEPLYHAFPGDKENGFDFTRFNPVFFRHLEMRIEQLGEIGIEADLILWHPYDNWGFSEMSHETDCRYLRYIIARLSSYRNVWWSLANEWDLLAKKSVTDWDDFFKILCKYDPVRHLRSIHNLKDYYDHHKPWVTHLSIQGRDLTKVSDLMDTYSKPVIYDECAYEGDIEHNWGNITALEMVNRMWEGFARGAYVGHGETYYNDEEVLWWSKGGKLIGESPKRIAFMREIFEALPGTPEVMPVAFMMRPCGIHVGKDYYLFYYGSSQQKRQMVSLPEENNYRAEIIDVWECTITEIPGSWSGNCMLPMPGKCYQALRLTKIK